MVDYESGIFGSQASPRVEHLARLAYTFADLKQADMRDPAGMGEVFVRLLGPCKLQFVLGMEPGDAAISYLDPARVFPGGCCVVTSVRVAAQQSAGWLSIALARACADFVAWNMGQVWPAKLVLAVALAIAMPEPAFAEEMAYLSPSELARAYVVPVEHVFQRLRALRGTRDSAEFDAITSAADATAK